MSPQENIAYDHSRGVPYKPRDVKDKPLNAEEGESGRHDTLLILDICITLSKFLSSGPSVWSFIIAITEHKTHKCPI